MRAINLRDERSLTDTSPRRSGGIAARMAQIPKLIVRWLGPEMGVPALES
jgi:hypothetical protein